MTWSEIGYWIEAANDYSERVRKEVESDSKR
jgi:hypothetical protein